MSDTSETGAKRAKVKTKTKTKGMRPGLRGWTASADGASLSRTRTYASPEMAVKVGQRALAAFQKASSSVELRLEGESLTMRVDASGGQIDEKMKRLAKRFGPRDPLLVAAKKAKRAAKTESGETQQGGATE